MTVYIMTVYIMTVSNESNYCCALISLTQTTPSLNVFLVNYCHWQLDLTCLQCVLFLTFLS